QALLDPGHRECLARAGGQCEHGRPAVMTGVAGADLRALAGRARPPALSATGADPFEDLLLAARGTLDPDPQFVAVSFDPEVHARLLHRRSGEVLPRVHCKPVGVAVNG